MNPTEEQIKQMKEILSAIAWPKRGSDEEQMDIHDFASLIMQKFPRDLLDN